MTMDKIDQDGVINEATNQSGTYDEEKIYATPCTYIDRISQKCRI